MAGVNVGRVLLGGVVAGIVVNIGEALWNGAVLGDRWEQARAALGLGAEGMDTFVLYLVWCFLMGFVMVAVYAGIRPRFGPGPRTALLAGALVWLPGSFGLALAVMGAGFLPASLAWRVTAGELPVFLLGALAGGWLYKEEATFAKATERSS